MHSLLFSEQMAVTAGGRMYAPALTVACYSACWASCNCLKSCWSHACDKVLTKPILEHQSFSGCGAFSSSHDGDCIETCRHR